MPHLPGLLGLGPLPLWWEIALIIASLGLTTLTFDAITPAVARDYLSLTPTVGSAYPGNWQNGISLLVCPCSTLGRKFDSRPAASPAMVLFEGRHDWAPGARRGISPKYPSGTR